MASGVYSSLDRARSSAVVDDPAVVEGELPAGQRGHRQPGRLVGVAAGDRVGQVGGEREVGDRDDPHPRVAVGCAVAAELLQVYAAQPLAAEPGLLGQLASGAGGAGPRRGGRSRRAAPSAPRRVPGRAGSAAGAARRRGWSAPPRRRSPRPRVGPGVVRGEELLLVHRVSLILRTSRSENNLAHASAPAKRGARQRTRPARCGRPRESCRANPPSGRRAKLTVLGSGTGSLKATSTV